MHTAILTLDSDLLALLLANFSLSMSSTPGGMHPSATSFDTTVSKL